jgi:hypothetical protein
MFFLCKMVNVLCRINSLAKYLNNLKNLMDTSTGHP